MKNRAKQGKQLIQGCMKQKTKINFILDLDGNEIYLERRGSLRVLKNSERNFKIFYRTLKVLCTNSDFFFKWELYSSLMVVCHP